MKENGWVSILAAIGLVACSVTAGRITYWTLIVTASAWGPLFQLTANPVGCAVLGTLVGAAVAVFLFVKACDHG